jgi:hypothetical protein
MMQTSCFDQALVLPPEQRSFVDESGILGAEPRRFRGRLFDRGEVVLDHAKVSLDLAPYSQDDFSFSLVGHDDSRFVEGAEAYTQVALPFTRRLDRESAAPMAGGLSERPVFYWLKPDPPVEGLPDGSRHSLGARPCSRARPTARD